MKPRSPSMPPLNFPIELTDWRRDETSIGRVSLRMLQRRPVIDIRVFELLPNGTYQPTMRGVMASLHQLENIAAALNRAVEIARAKGLIAREASPSAPRKPAR